MAAWNQAFQEWMLRTTQGGAAGRQASKKRSNTPWLVVGLFFFGLDDVVFLYWDGSDFLKLWVSNGFKCVGSTLGLATYIDIQSFIFQWVVLNPLTQI